MRTRVCVSPRAAPGCEKGSGRSEYCTVAYASPITEEKLAPMSPVFTDRSRHRDPSGEHAAMALKHTCQDVCHARSRTGAATTARLNRSPVFCPTEPDIGALRWNKHKIRFQTSKHRFPKPSTIPFQVHRNREIWAAVSAGQRRVQAWVYPRRPSASASVRPKLQALPKIQDRARVINERSRRPYYCPRVCMLRLWRARVPHRQLLGLPLGR